MLDAVKEEIEEVTKTPDTEDEEYENFFLQPARTPYNISEKVVEANDALCKEIEDNNRVFRVKFSEQLVDYEPELTDDDVQSIESYIDETNEEFQYIIKDEEDEIIYEEIEEEVEIIDEVIEEALELIIASSPKSPTKVVVEEQRRVLQPRPKSARQKPSKPRRSKVRYNIDCKSHCVTELDSPLELCISRLQLGDKPLCPTLKLHKRKCCDENKPNKNLPNYTGLRSEYGLSSVQLKAQEKSYRMNFLRDQKRAELEEEFKRRRIQQNEAVFKQWLSEIAHRNEQPKAIVRPQTSNSCCSGRKLKIDRKRRPLTSSNCVLIELPKYGCYKIGNVLVKQELGGVKPKQLHISTIS